MTIGSRRRNDIISLCDRSLTLDEIADLSEFVWFQRASPQGQVETPRPTERHGEMVLASAIYQRPRLEYAAFADCVVRTERF